MKSINFFNNEIGKLLIKFPKIRPKLSKEIQTYFNKFYKLNRENLISQIFESWMHKVIKKIKIKNNTLEIGAGTLNHLGYEDLKISKYDIIEPKVFLFKNKKKRFKLNKIYKNLKSVKNNFYDRIISIAVLEHLVDLPYFLAESSKKLKKKSFQSHSIPCQGYLLWDVCWYLFNFIKVKINTGKSFKEIQSYEHVNNANEILRLIKYFYKHVEVKYSYPFYFSPYFSFYMNINFSNPDFNKIKNYMYWRKFKKIKNVNT